MEFLQESNDTNIIEIWVEQRGRKTDTYISGWSIDENELKKNLKIIKKNKGCNGTIKDIIKETGKIKVMQLQGNQKDYVIDYLKNLGIDENSIKIKL
jgi:translation initiation factor 1 (eIF-1/SUI1)